MSKLKKVFIFVELDMKTPIFPARQLGRVRSTIRLIGMLLNYSICFINLKQLYINLFAQITIGDPSLI